MQKNIKKQEATNKLQCGNVVVQELTIKKENKYCVETAFNNNIDNDEHIQRL